MVREMNANGKQNASNTATQALNRIAEIGRAILVVCSIGTLCLVLLTVGFGYTAWSAIAARNAMVAGLEGMSSDMNRAMNPHRSTRK